MNDNENQTEGDADIMNLRDHASVDKDGNDIAGETGMGWFPGYAIDVKSGARLYMAFGENSFLAGDNGADMIWNPTNRMMDNMERQSLVECTFMYLYSFRRKITQRISCSSCNDEQMSCTMISSIAGNSTA